MTSWIKQKIQRQSKLEGKIRLSFQLVLLSVAVVMVLTLTVGIIVHYRMLTDSLRESTMKRYKDGVRHNVETMITTIEATVPFEIGPDMDQTAQKYLTDIIHEAQYDSPNGYYFVFDKDGKVIAQRIQRNREGTYRRYNKDGDNGNGIHYVLLLIDAARRGGDFVEYMMEKPEQEGKEKFPKIAYAKMLRGNQWWVGSGVYVDAIDADIRALNKKLLLQAGSVMILSGGFLLGLLWIAIRLSAMLGQHITRPIAELVNGANTLAKEEYGYRVAVDTQDELKLLADTFNMMAERIGYKVTARMGLKNAVNKTRKLLAGELHNRGGVFVLEVKKWLRQIAQEPDEDVRDELLHKCSECVGRFKQECNAIAFGVYPKTVDDLGVAKAFKYFVVEKTQPIQDLLVDLDIDTEMPRSDSEREIALYLVGEGLVLNVVQYAQASQVSISMKYADEVVILTVHDDGIGFDRDTALKNKSIEASHFGLPWVKAQVGVYQGRVDIDTSHGAGTKVCVSLPWPKVEIENVS